MLSIQQGHISSPIALSIPDLSIPAGTIMALTGANSSGKTTLLKAIAGRRLSAQRFTMENCVFIEHPPVMAERVRTEEWLSWMLKIHRAKESLAMILKDYDLECVSKTMASKLSSGAQKRLCCALAQINPAPVVIFDEPTSTVDAHSSTLIHQGFSRMKAQGRVVLFSTHHQEDLKYRRWLHLSNGILTCCASEEESLDVHVA